MTGDGGEAASRPEFEELKLSTLLDKAGTGMWLVRAAGLEQQKVSRFHNLHERFSNLRPSSMAPAILEKTAGIISRGSGVGVQCVQCRAR